MSILSNSHVRTILCMKLVSEGLMCFRELIFLCTDSDDEEEDEDVKTAFKPQVILEPKVG